MSSPGWSLQSSRYRPMMALGLMLLAMAAILINLLAGPVSIPFAVLWQSLWSSVNAAAGPDAVAAEVLWQLRMPRLLLGLLVGGQLAMAGAILQVVLRNPLADSHILGISGGASLLAVLLFLFATDGVLTLAVWDWQVSVLYMMPWAATAGGLLAAGLVFRLSAAGGLTPMRLVLCGIAVASVLNALVGGILAGWGHANAETVLAWLAGTLYGRDWLYVWALLPWSVLGLLLLPVMAKPLNLLQLGEESASSLGLSVTRWRGLSLVVASLLAASAVGMVGPVGFVGLLVPPIAQALVGSDMRRQLPLSGVLGALLVVAADGVGRSMPGVNELPVGVVTSLVGVPFFIYVLRRQS
ncbi:MAG: iron ABC transporter permease [Marinobacter sp.]|uniref:FecCD family ABC transporter permease n=1 Tax=Marinobacter sp. TaxID=50741 RepID=UPI00299F040E|nr:iron ABC transporter permease [Marinobacter sp.]MDX1756489.1 iron ABC transporter permease [Marinobacter sp.]